MPQSLSTKSTACRHNSGEGSRKPARNGSTSLHRRKRVRFASFAIVEYLPARCEMEINERTVTWWSLEEFRCMTVEASLRADETRRSTALIESLDHALREARRAALQQQTPQLVSDEQSLRLWCQYGHFRRGLERMTSPLHDATRSNIINKVRKRVVALSQSGANAEEIRQASEKATRSSIIFARMLGLADAQAALHPFPIAKRKRPPVVRKSSGKTMPSTKSLLTSFTSFQSTTYIINLER